MLSPKRDLVVARHFLQLAMWRSAVRPRVINVDGHPAYARAMTNLKKVGELGPRCRCRTAPYLNNIVEQDHRFIKKRIAASLGFRSVTGALNTIAGYEAMAHDQKRTGSVAAQGRCHYPNPFHRSDPRHRCVAPRESQRLNSAHDSAFATEPDLEVFRAIGCFFDQPAGRQRTSLFPLAIHRLYYSINAVHTALAEGSPRIVASRQEEVTDGVS